MADLTITAGNVIAGSDARIAQGVAGATVTAGQVVYLDSADGRFKLADSDAATAPVRLPAGIALNGASNGQPLSVAQAGSVTMGATLVAGTTYYLSDEPGGICPLGDLTTGDFTVVVGMATTAAVLVVHIQSSGVAL